MSTHAPINSRVEFTNRLRDLASECSGLGWIMKGYGKSLAQDVANKARESYKVTAAECQALLTQAPKFFNDYQELDAWVRSQNCSEDLNEFVVPYALGLDSDDLTDISRWVGDGLRAFHSMDDHPSMALARARMFQMHAPYSDDEPNADVPLTRPSFFHKGHFRHGFLHQQVSRPQVDDCINSISDSARHNAAQTAKWVNIIHKASVEHSETGEVVKKMLGEHLRSVSTEGLETLREYIIGSHTPTGRECSERAAKLLGAMVYRELEPEDISAHLAPIRLNERYFSTLLFGELTQTLAQTCRHFNDNERGDEYDAGAQGAKQFTELFTQLGLTPQALVSTAMTVSARFSPGQQMDLCDRPVVEQMDEVLTFVLSEHLVTLNPAGNLRHAVLLAVLNTLPDEIVTEIAQQRDASRLAMYQLTGQDIHLRGLKDKKIAESAFSADLGL